MKCPHCGMNIRDEVTECGYCGGRIDRRPGKPVTGTGRYAASGGSTAQTGAQRPQKQTDEPEPGDEEEEGGLTAILQPGEQVLIGSLNVTVKKFFFHAYLTNRRIFLIDTQEKKLKVTAKDVPRDTIAGSIVEFSESSDPVLVLSIKSGDDEIKTMKLVFVQSGMDRSGEIDEWIALLHEEEPPKKSPRRPAPEPEEPVEDREPVFARPPEKPRQNQELHPAKKPLKDHERQPPVKRLLSLYKVPDEEPVQVPEPEPEAVVPPRRTTVRQVTEPAKRQVVASSYNREIPPTRESGAPPVRKPEVQSAMKVAIKGAMSQTGQQPQQPVKKTVVESQKRYLPEVEPEAEIVPPRRPVVQETVQEKPVPDELADMPQFCHNCGKKLPHSANFCPGCGTKLSQGRTLPHSRTTPPVSSRKATRTDPPGHEHRPIPEDIDEDEIDEDKPILTRPPVKKAPKGSEMTILHKFLRR
jgi:hypothetical protein